MKSRWIAALLLACGVVGADPDADLAFAERLNARGFSDMALKVLNDLESSGDPKAVKAGRYGKAVLKKQEASLARWRFLRALEAGETPEVTREQVLALYAAAEPAIEEYVGQAADPMIPRSLLAQVIQEHAEFLAGADYPEEMKEEVARLVEQNRAECEKLFQRATETYVAMLEPYTSGKEKRPTDVTDPLYVQITNAEFQKGIARMRWAMIYPSGTSFQYRIDEAIEEIDTFLQKHYEELFGAYAMMNLGICYYERGLRQGDVDDAEIAINYFETLYGQLDENPEVPATMDVLGRAFYWYAKTCNAIASQAGALKKKKPVFYDNARGVARKMTAKLRQGLKTEWALRAMLEVAEAEAARGDYEEAVRVAGDALSKARFERLAGVTKAATEKLIAWVASVQTAGALEPSLLYQIGQSLAAQDRVGNAITFFEKAVAAVHTDDGRIEVGYPAQLEIARAYRRDKRYYAAAQVGMEVVNEFVKSKQDDESDFGLIAGECCNVARLAWRQISEYTKASADEAKYQQVTQIFRDKFPGHKENSDAAFSEAMEIYSRGNYEEAAKKFKDINPASRNYWRAQRQVPACYRRLADEDEKGAPQWHEACLKAAQDLRKLSAANSAEPAAKRGEQFGLLFEALSHAGLEQWAEAIKTAAEYLNTYPDDFPKRGLLPYVKVQGHLALKQLADAESTLAFMKEKLADSSYTKRANFEVYLALRKAYKEMDSGPEKAQTAHRAAKLWEARVKDMERPDATSLFILGDNLRDAQQWQAAADAFTGAADTESEQRKKTYYSLQAAMMQYQALKTATDISAKEKLDKLNAARQLFTDVLIPDRKDQETVLKALAEAAKKWPAPAVWDKIAKKPDVLLSAAQIYRDSSPAGLNGRIIAIHLIDYLHTFTRPSAEEGRESKTDEYIETWWDGAQLQLEVSLELAKSGAPEGKVYADRAFKLAGKLLFEHAKMDGPARRRAFERLSAELKNYR